MLVQLNFLKLFFSGYEDFDWNLSNLQSLSFSSPLQVSHLHTLQERGRTTSVGTNTAVVRSFLILLVSSEHPSLDFYFRHVRRSWLFCDESALLWWAMRQWINRLASPLWSSEHHCFTKLHTAPSSGCVWRFYYGPVFIWGLSWLTAGEPALQNKTQIRSPYLFIYFFTGDSFNCFVSECG